MAGLAAFLALMALLWQGLLAPVPEQSPLTGAVDRIEIDKSDRQMVLYAGDTALRSYPVALGFAPEGDKRQEGDGKTPEGLFHVDRRNPTSRYHLSLGLDYPRPQDIARARAAGVDPGGDIFIHGQPAMVPDGMMIPGDWTAGCIALTDAQMDEIWPHIPIGTPVEIRP